MFLVIKANGCIFSFYRISYSSQTCGVINPCSRNKEKSQNQRHSLLVGQPMVADYLIEHRIQPPMTGSFSAIFTSKSIQEHHHGTIISLARLICCQVLLLRERKSRSRWYRTCQWYSMYERKRNRRLLPLPIWP